jgi:MoaA/NifB/PqqE/SkfB family radical SAM enzyme
MGPTGSRYRILQIHPTRRCNLRCLHCYSVSGPEERDQLSAELLREAITDGAAAGYTVAGFSGGEPLLYKPLHELLEHAHACGMLTTVTSNGMLLTERKLALLGGRLDLLAISLDGPPESHNRMRASEHAFDGMLKRLEGVRRSGIPFGFIFTLTQHNVHELDWVAGFALEQGAKLLQIHPLEEAGRARQLLAGQRPDGVESAYAFLEARRIQELAGDRLLVHLDLAHRTLLASEPGRVFADDGSQGNGIGRPLAEFVSPLIIEADGTVVPIEYGFPRPYALGNLTEAPLRELGPRWLTERHGDFRRLSRNVFEEVTAPTDLPFTNWYELMAERAAHALEPAV